jgi:hypothetical protein
MKATCNGITLCIIALALGSCNALTLITTPTPSPTTTSSPTATSLPTQTSSVTPSPAPTVTSTTAAPAEMPTPNGTPAAEWAGLPIMPGAIAGEVSNGGYTFTIKTSPSAVEAFYESKLPKLGWNLLGTGKGETGALLLIFTRGSGTLTVGIIPQANGLIYVMFVTL